MWAISEDILSDELINEILDRADYLISSNDREKHVFVDKDFFSNNGDEPRNLDILNILIHYFLVHYRINNIIVN